MLAPTRHALPLAYSHLHPCQNLIATQEAGHGSRKNQSSGAFRLEPEAAMAFEELFTVASIVVHYITNHVLFGTLDLMGTGVGEDDVDGGMMEFLELLCICVILGLAYLGLSLAGCSCNGVRAAIARCCKGCERLFFGY